MEQWGPGWAPFLFGQNVSEWPASNEWSQTPITRSVGNARALKTQRALAGANALWNSLRF